MCEGTEILIKGTRLLSSGTPIIRINGETCSPIRLEEWNDEAIQCKSSITSKEQQIISLSYGKRTISTNEWTFQQTLPSISSISPTTIYVTDNKEIAIILINYAECGPNDSLSLTLNDENSSIPLVILEKEILKEGKLKLKAQIDNKLSSEEGIYKLKILINGKISLTAPSNLNFKISHQRQIRRLQTAMTISPSYLFPGVSQTVIATFDASTSDNDPNNWTFTIGGVSLTNLQVTSSTIQGDYDGSLTVSSVTAIIQNTSLSVSLTYSVTIQELITSISPTNVNYFFIFS